jgi:hypothetical protein
MIDLDNNEQVDQDRTEASARLEAKRIRELFKEVFSNDDAQEALQILRSYFDADTPSAPTSNFEPYKAFYMDGHKAVFKLITDIIEGKYNEH